MEMYKILIACVSGMSTSMLVSKIRKVSVDFNFPIQVSFACESEIEKIALENDIVILGPQLRTARRRFEKKLCKYNIPVVSVPIALFSEMDAKGILEFAIQEINIQRGVNKDEHL